MVKGNLGLKIIGLKILGLKELRDFRVEGF